MRSNCCLSEADTCKGSILHQSSSNSSTVEWLSWKLDQIMVLHRRSSKLNNVLYFLNTSNLPLPGSVGWWRFLSLSCWDTAQKFQESKSPVSWESASGCLQPWTESPGLHRALTQPHPPHGEHWMSSADSNQGPESPHCQSAEKTRAKRTPGDEHLWTFHPSSTLLNPEAQPLRKTVLFTEHRHTLLVCLFASPQNNSLLQWALKPANKVG